MKNRIVLILLLPFIAEFFISCCDCGDPVEVSYSHCSISTRLLDQMNSEPVVVSDPEFIPATDFGIELALERSASLCLFEPSTFSVFTEASATTCDCQDFDSTPREKIVEIRVFTLSDFNEEILAGDEVTNLFLERKFNGTSEGLITAVDQIIYDYRYTEFEPYIMDLKLIQAPDEQGDFQFRLEVELTDERVLEVITPAVLLM